MLRSKGAWKRLAAALACLAVVATAGCDGDASASASPSRCGDGYVTNEVWTGPKPAPKPGSPSYGLGIYGSGGGSSDSGDNSGGGGGGGDSSGAGAGADNSGGGGGDNSGGGGGDNSGGGGGDNSGGGGGDNSGGGGGDDSGGGGDGSGWDDPDSFSHLHFTTAHATNATACFSCTVACDASGGSGVSHIAIGASETSHSDACDSGLIAFDQWAHATNQGHVLSCWQVAR